MKIGILGSNGFLGNNLYCYFKNMKYDVYGINKTNYSHYCDYYFDIFINANGNSNKYWVNDNILKDFEISTLSVYRTLFDFNINYYIYISSVNVYSGNSSNEETIIDLEKLCSYGFHKYISEMVIKKYINKYVILRCSSIIGDGMKKGIIKDIINGNPIFVTLDSKIQFISTLEIFNIIMKLIDNNIFNEIFNVCGFDSILCSRLNEVFYNKKFTIHKDSKKQIYDINVSKLKNIFPIKTSEFYIKEFIKGK